MRHGIMDYSVLLGIENVVHSGAVSDELVDTYEGANAFDDKILGRHRHSSPNQMQSYHLSLIDYLQQWNSKKRGEQFLKT